MPLTDQSQSNVNAILGSQSQTVGQLSDDILLNCPFAGSKAVEQAITLKASAL